MSGQGIRGKCSEMYFEIILSACQSRERPGKIKRKVNEGKSLRSFFALI